jgi:hypothetical protein
MSFDAFSQPKLLSSDIGYRPPLSEEPNNLRITVDLECGYSVLNPPFPKGQTGGRKRWSHTSLSGDVVRLANVRLQARAARGASLCKPLLGGTLCDSA